MLASDVRAVGMEDVAKEIREVHARFRLAGDLSAIKREADRDPFSCLGLHHARASDTLAAARTFLPSTKARWRR